MFQCNLKCHRLFNFCTARHLSSGRPEEACFRKSPSWGCVWDKSTSSLHQGEANGHRVPCKGPGSVTVHHWHWKLSIWLEVKLEWVLGEDAKFLAEWKSRWKSRGRRKRFCCPVLKTHLLQARRNAPLWGKTTNQSLLSLAQLNWLTLPCRVGPLVTAATSSCLAGFVVSAGGLWRIIAASWLSPSLIWLVPHLTHTDNLQLPLLRSRRGQLLTASSCWTWRLCVQAGKSCCLRACVPFQFVSDNPLQLLIVNNACDSDT